ncbi:MAG: hypothetical protein PHH37_06205 [Paludibacter sp.]|nr:hypothetical protein [Paludibacter sp.]
MSRVSSQLIFCGNDNILKNTVIERNAAGKIERLIPLEVQQHETARTIFYNGIISSNPFSISEHLDSETFFNLKKNVNYFTPDEIPAYNPQKKLIIDLKGTDQKHISAFFNQLIAEIPQLSSEQIINAACYYPAFICQSDNVIIENNDPVLVLWLGFDLRSGKMISPVSFTII